MISLKAHNVLDYVAGAALIFLPAFAGFEGANSARNAFFFVGLFWIAYSLATNYPFALWRRIPLGVHMVLDSVSAIALMAAPWVIGYRVRLTEGEESLHYLAGILLLALVAVTRSKTEAEKRLHEPTYPGRYSAAG